MIILQFDFLKSTPLHAYNLASLNTELTNTLLFKRQLIH